MVGVGLVLVLGVAGLLPGLTSALTLLRAERVEGRLSSGGDKEWRRLLAATARGSP